MTGTRVGLIGAGRMAHEHLSSLLDMGALEVSAVVDPDQRAARALARRAGGQVQVFDSTAQALAAQAFERAHVVVPPQLHADICRQLLTAGVHCLVEKPFCTDPAMARQLQELAASRHLCLGVGHNLVFHPALVKFKRALDAGRYGRLRFVSLVVAVRLAQLQTRRFDHWMFEQPSNIILEQMVHPLSQLAHLLGPLQIAAATAAPAAEVAPGVRFHKSFEVTLQGAQGRAQLHMAFGESFPVWQISALCDDGLVVVDCVRNSVGSTLHTRYLEAGDIALGLASQGFSLLGQAGAGIGRYLASQLRLAPRGDVFFRGVKASIEDFHAAVDAGRAPLCDGQFGAALVETCMAIAREANVSTASAPAPATLLPGQAPVPQFDVAVFGGTGFIGKAVVQQLLVAGYTVGVIARGVRGLPRWFHDPRVTLIRGDVTRREDVERGVGNARWVINLAHGGTGDTRQATIALVAGAARTVGEVCLDKRVERLVFISSIAALYLGDPSRVILPSTPSDEHARLRSDYSEAKSQAERALLELHRTRGLPVTIQRPGIVLGEGGSPFHSGLGLFNNDTHCLGWNGGHNPLPFVLVDDVAAAIVAALTAGPDIVGRTDNIVGRVRLTASEYIEELGRLLGRPLRFHAQSLPVQLGVEWGKWLIKTAGGKHPRRPSARDFLSRGMPARFDVSETEALLSWAPTGDRQAFIERGLVRPARALLD